MIKNLQIALLVLLTVAFSSSIPALWLGISPELSLLEFLSRWDSFGTLASTFAIYVGVIAYIFGWSPQSRSLTWFRDRVLIKVLSNSWMLALVNTGLLLLILLNSSFLYRFRTPPNSAILDAIFSENYAAVDQELASVDLSEDDIAALYFINDSIRQRFFLTSQDADKELCLVYLNYFSKANQPFTLIWQRYLQTYAQASCMQVLENPKAAVQYSELSKLYAEWLGQDEVRRAARKIAEIYFNDDNGVAGISEENERYRYIITLIGSDPNESAQRMVGASYYLLGELSKAVETWSALLSAMDSTQSVPQKRLLNNIALAYARLNQNSLAADTVDQGLSLPFVEGAENERREQVRLMSTKTLVQLKTNSCAAAMATWDARNALVQQGLTQCNALISAQVMACGNEATNRAGVIDGLLNGVGQDPATFIDRTPEALSSLIEQAEITFDGCYQGLEFNKNAVELVVLASAGPE